MRRGSIAEFEIYFNSLNGNFCGFFACLTQNVLNAGNKWHPHIYVIVGYLSFAHAFFNNHVTLPQKKKQLKSSLTIALWRNLAVFYTFRRITMHRRIKKVRDVDKFNISENQVHSLHITSFLDKRRLLHTLLPYPGLNLPVYLEMQYQRVL